jgi:hypothetical protein
MTPIRLSAELLGSTFVAMNIGDGVALVETGTAEVEQDGRHYHVSVSVLGTDGNTSRWMLPDSYADELLAQGLAGSINL